MGNLLLLPTIFKFSSLPNFYGSYFCFLLLLSICAKRRFIIDGNDVVVNRHTLGISYWMWQNRWWWAKERNSRNTLSRHRDTRAYPRYLHILTLYTEQYSYLHHVSTYHLRETHVCLNRQQSVRVFYLWIPSATVKRPLMLSSHYSAVIRGRAFPYE